MAFPKVFPKLPLWRTKTLLNILIDEGYPLTLARSTQTNRAKLWSNWIFATMSRPSKTSWRGILGHNLLEQNPNRTTTPVETLIKREATKDVNLQLLEKVIYNTYPWLNPYLKRIRRVRIRRRWIMEKSWRLVKQLWTTVMEFQITCRSLQGGNGFRASTRISKRLA